MRSFDSVVEQAINENALHYDIATPATDAERVFWDACVVSALSRCTASEAAVQASWALVYKRQSEQRGADARADRWRCANCGAAGPLASGATAPGACPYCLRALS